MKDTADKFLGMYDELSKRFFKIIWRGKTYVLDVVLEKMFSKTDFKDMKTIKAKNASGTTVSLNRRIVSDDFLFPPYFAADESECTPALERLL